MNGTSEVCPSPVLAAKWAPRLALSCRWVLAVVFLMAAVTKIMDLQGFADQLIVRSRLSPTLCIYLAQILPWLELTCGFCFVIGYAVREAALLSNWLLALLFGYSLMHLGEGDCGCFVFPNSRNTDLTWWPPVRNFLLILASGWVVWQYAESPAKPPRAPTQG